MSLTDLAKKHRKNQTDAEALLWKYLRRGQLDSIRFRRQQPIGLFIADFISYKVRIGIELDGGQHAQMITRDSKRDMWFHEQGFKVLRFWNGEVLQNTEAVLEIIFQEAKGRWPGVNNSNKPGPMARSG